MQQRCSSIREGDSQGLQRVHAFHRRKNEESLQAYLARIKAEERLEKQNHSRMQGLKKDLKKLEKSVSLKQNYLQCLEGEIGNFKTDIRAYNGSRLRGKSREPGEEGRKDGKEAFSSLYKDAEGRSERTE
jgi:hypothetical protein